MSAVVPPHPYMPAVARELVRRGLAVFPIPTWGRVPSPGWQRTVTVDLDRVDEMFAGGQNVGVGCRASDVVVLDLDKPHGTPVMAGGNAPGADGVAGWDELCARRGQAPPVTFTVVTPHGGRHLYFQAPFDAVVTSSSGPRPELPPGIDVRAPGRRSGGYVLGAGSQVPDGRYRVAQDVPIAPLPGWLCALLTDPVAELADALRTAGFGGGAVGRGPNEEVAVRLPVREAEGLLRLLGLGETGIVAMALNEVGVRPLGGSAMWNSPVPAQSLYLDEPGAHRLARLVREAAAQAQ